MNPQERRHKREYGNVAQTEDRKFILTAALTAGGSAACKFLKWNTATLVWEASSVIATVYDPLGRFSGAIGAKGLCRWCNASKHWEILELGGSTTTHPYFDGDTDNGAVNYTQFSAAIIAGNRDIIPILTTGPQTLNYGFTILPSAIRLDGEAGVYQVTLTGYVFVRPTIDVGTGVGVTAWISTNVYGGLSLGQNHHNSPISVASRTYHLPFAATILLALNPMDTVTPMYLVDFGLSGGTITGGVLANLTIHWVAPNPIPITPGQTPGGGQGGGQPGGGQPPGPILPPVQPPGTPLPVVPPAPIIEPPGGGGQVGGGQLIGQQSVEGGGSTAQPPIFKTQF